MASDAWFVGYTPELATAVWIGFLDARTAHDAAGDPHHRHGWDVAGADLAALPEHGARGGARVVVPRAGRAHAVDDHHDQWPGPALLRRHAPRRRATAPRDAGFRVRTDSRTSRQYPPGTVVAQQPAAGTPATPGELVTIVLASGPPLQSVVPSVLGQLTDQAALALSTRGCRSR